jgi:hypothetical protein
MKNWVWIIILIPVIGIILYFVYKNMQANNQPPETGSGGGVVERPPVEELQENGTEVFVGNAVYLSPRIVDGKIQNKWIMEVRFPSDSTNVRPLNRIRLEGTKQADWDKIHLVEETWLGPDNHTARTAMIQVHGTPINKVITPPATDPVKVYRQL